MHAARVLAGGEQAGDGGRAIGVEFGPTHHVMGRGHDLDQAFGQIETAIGAAFDHALEVLAHLGRVQVLHGDVKPAVGGNVAGPHFREHGAGHDIAGRALAPIIILVHEALLVPAQKIAAEAAQAFFDDGTGHARVGAGDQARGVELHHFHVAQAQPRAHGHGHAVTGFVARRRVIFVHGRPAAGRQQHGLGLDEAELPRAHVDEQHAGNARAVL